VIVHLSLLLFRVDSSDAISLALNCCLKGQGSHWPCSRCRWCCLKALQRRAARVVIRGIGEERNGADSGVEFALDISLEGKRTNRCVICAAGKVKQGALFFRCVSPGLTPAGGALTACILWARNKPTNASATRMRTDAKPRMVRSELLEVVIVFMPAVAFFGLIVFTS
jgi:hypothetical protein